MKNQYAVIFDRDGVLTYFDVEGAVAFFQPLVPLSIFELGKQWQAWGSETGFPSTVQEEEHFFAGFWRMIQQKHELSEAQYRALVSFHYTDYMRSYSEVSEVLQELAERGVPVGVLSNFSLASLDASLDAVGLRQWIQVACAATVIGYAKPEPESYRHVAELLRRPPEACLFFDDETLCVAGAAMVGMGAYLVDRQRSDDDIENSTVCSLRAVLDLLDA